MTYTIQFHPQIKYEIKDSYNWYESKTIGLGESLLLELEDAFSLIQEAPHIWSKKRNIFSRYVVQRFPFSIYYTVENENIYIYAVAHSSRKPYYWKERSSI